MTDPFRDELQAALGPAYVIDRELAGGGMSRVFVARERALDREVVIKVLPPDLAAGVNRERFRREIQLAAQLQHPHIVPLLAAGESGDLLYYTMPFIRGESLRTAIETRGALPVREVVRILHDVVDALACAHERGVIHRDIKPANVLMSGSHALITDFGVAKALSAALPFSGVTTAGVAIGTPAYMAPEQLAGDPDADHRVDIYAVGLLAYELLAGGSPFAGESPQATMAAQLTRIPEPLAKVRPEVPLELSRIIERCLAKSRADRPATAAALLAELDAVSTPSGTLVGDARLSHGAPRRWVAAASVLLTVAIGSALALSRGRTPRAAGVHRMPDDASVAAPPVPPVPSPRTTAATLLTHEDSLAIARAVERRVDDGAARAAAGAPVQLRAEIARALGDSVRAARAQLYATLLDSMRTAMDSAERARWLPSVPSRAEVRRFIPGMAGRPPGAPPAADLQGRFIVVDPTHLADAARVAVNPWAALVDSVDPAAARRIAVAAEFPNATEHPEITARARSAADSLRTLLRAHGGYDVIAVPTREHGNDPLALARASHAPMSIMGLVRSQGDSAYLWIYVTDLRRGPNFHAFVGRHAPLDDPLRGIEAIAAQIAGWLDRPERPHR